MTAKVAKNGRFHIGDRVRFMFGVVKVVGTVTEDRGPIGVGGRHLYGVRFSFSEGDPIYTEMPEADLELANDEPSTVSKDR